MDSGIWFVLCVGALGVATITAYSVHIFVDGKYGGQRKVDKVEAEFAELKEEIEEFKREMRRVYDKVDPEQINKVQASLNELSVRIGMRGR